MFKFDTKNLICIVFLLLLCSLFFLSPWPNDLGDIGMSFFSNNSLLLKAHQSKIPFSKFVIEKYGEPSRGYALTYYQTTFAYALGVIVPYLISAFLHISPFHSLLITMILCAFATVLVSFYLGSLLYNRLFGLVFAILIGTDIYFNINIRTGAPIFVLPIPLILLTCYFFLRAHLNGERKIIWIIAAGLFSSLCLLHGYPETYIVFPILILFLILALAIKPLMKLKILKSSQRSYRLLPVTYYLLFFLLTATLYLSFSFAWDAYNQVPLLTTHQWISKCNWGRYSGMFSIGLPELKTRVAKFLECIFIDMDKNAYFAGGGVHSDTSFPGQPVLPFFSSLFFILGMISIFRKRRENDLFLFLLFILTSFVLIFLFKPYTPRVYIFSTPFLLLVSSLGYVEVLNHLSARIKFLNKYPNIALSFLIACFLLINIPHYHKISRTFVIDRGGQKIWHNGWPRIYRYLQKERVDDKNLVVFGIGFSGVYDWLQELYVDGHGIETQFFYKEKEMRERFHHWRNKQLETYESIYFIFPSEYYHMEKPGLNYAFISMRGARDSFRESNPNLQPIKTIYSRKGIPLHYIYKLEKEPRQLTKKVRLAISRGEAVRIGTDKVYSGKAIYIRGPAKSIVFKSDGGEQRIPLNITRNMGIYLNFKGNSWVEFFPNFDEEREAFENVYSRERIQLKRGRGGFNWLEIMPPHNQGTLTYKIELPYRIIRLDLRTNPRIFNDYLKRNRVEAYYSLNGKDYEKIYEIISNGNGRYGKLILPGRGGDRDTRIDRAGFDEYSTYDILYPDSGILYIKFILKSPFSGSNAQLISHGKTMFLRARIDTQDMEEPIIEDDTEITIERDDEYETKTEVAITLCEMGYTSGLMEGKKKSETIKNLLPNGDFEVWSNYSGPGKNIAPDGWKPGGDVIVSREEEVTLTGNSALKLSGAPSGAANISYPYYKIQTLAGKIINLDAYVKTNVANIARLRLSEVTKQGEVTTVYSDFHSGSGNWELLRVSKRLGQSPSMILVTIFNSSSFPEDSVYLDKAVCYKGKPRRTVYYLD